MERGRKFIALMGTVHCDFKGLAFYRVKGKAQKINLKGRAIIDAASFKEFNPNYANVNADPEDPGSFALRLRERQRLAKESNIEKRSLQPDDISDNEAYLCPPTVSGFSLSKRIWGETP